MNFHRTPSSKERFVKARHVKAPTRLVASFGRSVATRASARRAKGSGAPAAKLLALVLLAAPAALVLGVSLASAAAPTVTVEPASNVGYTTAHVSGTVDPEGEATTYSFQYVTEAQFQENLANGLPVFEGAATGIEGTTEISGPVLGDLTGLIPDRTYHLRLVAENSEEEVAEALAATFTTEAVAKPTVSIEPVTASVATGANFVGHVDPNSPVPEGSVTTAACPNEAFRTGSSSALPDCRAYEQASPVDKNGSKGCVSAECRFVFRSTTTPEPPSPRQ
jgi:hypothetical protein